MCLDKITVLEIALQVGVQMKLKVTYVFNVRYKFQTAERAISDNKME